MMKFPVLLKPSTREMFAEARRTPGFSLLDFMHGYIYGRWPYFYISMGIGSHPLSKRLLPIAGRLVEWIAGSKPGSARATSVLVEPATPAVNEQAMTVANTYHGKVVPLEAARQLVQVQEEINLPDLEHIIPYDRARALILKNPQHIVALDCPCRLARENPCLPLDVCLIVGEPFASFIIEHQPAHARWIKSDEAVEILKAEDARGHVHHAFFKDAMLGRFYAICNCCPCCCGAMQAQQSGAPMLASSGYLAAVDDDLCLACGSCIDICPFDALSPGEVGGALVDSARCMGCGVCANQCPNSAIHLQRAPEKGEPLEILALMQQVL